MKTWNSYFTKKNSVFLLVLLLVVGLIMVLFSSKEETNQSPSSREISFEIEGYEEDLEKRLKGIIEKIDGVGSVSVMVTLKGSAFYSYATDTSQDLGKDGDSKKESTVVLSSENTSKKEAVVSGYTLPEVKGAAVVCSNKLSDTLRKRVIDVVSASLGISSAKICVTN